MINIPSKINFIKPVKDTLRAHYPENEIFLNDEEFNTSNYEYLAAELYSNPLDRKRILKDSRLKKDEKWIYIECLWDLEIQENNNRQQLSQNNQFSLSNENSNLLILNQGDRDKFEKSKKI